MSSSMSDTRRPRHQGLLAPLRLVPALAVALALFAPAGPALSKEATARGKKADITWLDEKGVKQQAAAREIVYGYYTRVYLNVPKNGKSYKDETHEHKGVSLAGDYLSFSTLDKIELAWKQDDTAGGATRLSVTVTKANGKVVEVAGSTLAGASHPSSPYIAFTVDGQPHKIELNPMADAGDRAGKPQLVSVVFTL